VCGSKQRAPRAEAYADLSSWDPWPSNSQLPERGAGPTPPRGEFRLGGGSNPSGTSSLDPLRRPPDQAADRVRLWNDEAEEGV
jgi:hypothetical protein